VLTQRFTSTRKRSSLAGPTYDANQDGKLRCQIATRPLWQANEVLDELSHGQISGRIVLVLR